MSTPRSEWAFKSMATSDQLVKYISSIDSPDLKYLPSGTYLVTGTPTNTPPSFSSEGDIVLVRSIEWNNEGVTYSKVTLTSVLLGTTRTRDYNSDDGRFQWVGIYSTVMPLATKLYIDYKIGKNELESYKNTMKVELANAE
ncbi:MAG: hypothetical protein LBG59_08970 [Candidatus Peribacteria bacterium]|nr:hypothetical protein [Candidatus Peribacteria bacterium]